MQPTSVHKQLLTIVLQGAGLNLLYVNISLKRDFGSLVIFNLESYND